MKHHIKKGACLLLMIFAISHGHAHAELSTKTKVALAGAAFAAGTAITYTYSLAQLYTLFKKFRNEKEYKNSFFFTFDPYRNRLICKWEEDRWPTADVMQEFAMYYPQAFGQQLKNAANGAYISRYTNHPFYLLWFHHDMCCELHMINSLYRSMLIVSTLAFGLRSKAKEWLATLQKYEQRLKILQETIMQMPEYQMQLQARQNYDLTAMQQQSHVDVDLNVHEEGMQPLL